MVDELGATHSTALRITRDYQDYWRLLQQEIVSSRHLTDAKSSSTRLLAGLQEEWTCEDYQ